MLHHLVLESPVGPLTLVASSAGLCAVRMEDEAEDRVPLPPSHPASGPHPVLDSAARQLREYFARTRRVFDVPLDASGTPFQHACWDALRKIPYGQTRTYQEVAMKVGGQQHTGAVGAANGKNPLGIVVPCHRVVGSNGALVGFAAGVWRKRWLLDHEKGQLPLV